MLDQDLQRFDQEIRQNVLNELYRCFCGMDVRFEHECLQPDEEPIIPRCYCEPEDDYVCYACQELPEDAPRYVGIDLDDIPF